MKKRFAMLLALGGILLLAVIVGLSLRPEMSALLRHRMEKSLGERFASQVQFSDFRFSLFPRPAATVLNLKLSHHARKDIPPLIQIDQLSMTLHWRWFFTPRIHIASVALKGLVITFPPKQDEKSSAPTGWGRELPDKYPVFIDRLEAMDAQIVLLRAQPEKHPLIFLLHRLELKDLSFANPAQFEATLTNAVPRGEIHAKGTFGPWDPETPRATPVQASYQFLHADMATIKGLRGTLSSTGTFGGPLDYLSVKGTTTIPDFTLRRVDNPIELKTQFSATVDGTNGNTYLHSVVAHFLHSTLFTKGEVVDEDPKVRGRTINLDASSNAARAEDLIQLAVKTPQPVLRGPVKLQAKIRIPEEDTDLSDRLDVSSHFDLSDGHFSNPSIQDKIDTLSRKGQGEPKNTEIVHVPTQLTASMHLKKAIISFSQIQFFVPGARLDLQGDYTLGDGTLAFQGDLFLDAKLSQTTTGAKSFLLKAIDPFFKGKNGGAKIPIKVSGTKDHPEFGLGHEHSAKPASDTVHGSAGTD